ncbi:MFS transporter [Dactylosporangium sp. CS-047395]|uniref:MFS transporter n=1 Tax=Dactylosporangium sp. CS-047395 TaxID=3239936 RepID=UPI003D93649B
MRLLNSRNYRLWAAADLVSVTGTWMKVLGVNWFVLQATGSTTSMGLALMLQTLPILLLGPLGGALADRLPVRRILLATQAAHAVLSAGFAAVVLLGGQLWWLYALSFLTGMVTAADGPALGRFGGMVAGPELLGQALANGSLISSTGRIIGMSAGGVVAATAGPAALFIANAVSFSAVIAALLAMRTSSLHRLESAAPAEKGAVRAGFRYLATQPAVLVTLAVAFVLGSIGRNYQVTMAAMSFGPLSGGPAGYGVLSTVFAAGTVLGALAVGRFRALRHHLLIAAGLAASVLQMIAGAAPGLWSFAAVLIPIAAAAVIVDTTVTTRAQLDTSEDMRGRVLAAVALVSALGGMVGAPVLGALCEAVGPRETLVLAGAIGVLACAAGAVFLFGRRSSGVPALAD